MPLALTRETDVGHGSTVGDGDAAVAPGRLLGDASNIQQRLSKDQTPAPKCIDPPDLTYVLGEGGQLSQAGALAETQL
ncbi:hypothetical protein E5D57_012252 [Metarhizium anisopliae]|nr:hypothetical protein E5D57_012252 [Metarhizium anisopliae]